MTGSAFRRSMLRGAAAVLRRTTDFPGRWRVCQRALKEVRAVGGGMRPTTIRTKHGFLMECDPGDWVGQHIFVTGTWEDTTTRIVQACVTPGATVVDVGANIGFYTLLMSRLVGERGRVIAFEPMPLGIERLRRNLRLNDASNVDVIEQAASAQPGSASFFLGPREHTSISSLRPIEGAATVAVTCTTLDTVLAEHPRIDFLKMDVEGAEPDVLAGAGRTLRNGIPYVVAEVSSPDWPQTLLDLGFEMFEIRWNGIRPLKELAAPDLGSQYNAFFSTRGVPPGVPLLTS